MFQSTRPRGARRRNGIVYGAGENCFNPRARVGRDIDACLIFPMSGVFQSTRPRGARRFLLQRRYILAGSFNPRARVGRDRVSDARGECSTCFNPRARVGRDAMRTIVRLISGCFNPRARVGRDFFVRFLCGDFNVFQSTRPRGARLPQCYDSGLLH